MFLAALSTTVISVFPAPTEAATSVPTARIVFGRSDYDKEPAQRGIYTVRPDGSQLTRLTNQADSSPLWGPGHHWIAFERLFKTEGPTGSIYQERLYTMRSDGSEQTEIASTGGSYAWSPDGSRLAFSESGDIWTVDPDGSSKQQVTQAFSGGYELTWSPDGTRIAFVRSLDIYVVAAAGGQPEPLIVSSEEEFDPAWAPDGKTIAYTSTKGHFEGGEGPYSNDIWLMNPDGSDRRRLTQNCHWNSWLAWTPDSHQIVYGAGDDDDGCSNPQDSEIRVVDVGEGKVANGANLTSNRGEDYFPAVSPNGRWVVFQHHGLKNGNADADLWIVRLDGSGRREIVGPSPGIFEEDPDW